MKGMGQWQPSIVSDGAVLVTHAANVAIMERETGHPPRIIRTPDACYLFQAGEQERLSGLVDRWESYGIAAQVVLVSATARPLSRPRQAVAPERPQPG